MQNARKRRKGRLLKAAIMMLTILMTTTNCDNDVLITPEIEGQINRELTVLSDETEFINGEDDPEILAIISNQTVEDSSDKSLSLKNVKYKKTHINLNKILKTRDQNGVTNFSMELYVEDGPKYEFYNVVINESAKGKKKDAYIVRFAAEPEDFEYFLSNGGSMKYFKGSRTALSWDHFYHELDDHEHKSEGAAHDCGEPDYIDNTDGGEDGSISGIPSDNSLVPIGVYQDLAEGPDTYEYEIDGYTSAGEQNSHSSNVNNGSVSAAAGNFSYGVIGTDSMDLGRLGNVKFRIHKNLAGQCTLVIQKVHRNGSSWTNISLDQCPPQMENSHYHKDAPTQSKSAHDCIIVEEGTVSHFELDMYDKINTILNCVTDLTEVQANSLDIMHNSPSIGMHMYRIFNYLTNNCTPESKQFTKDVIDAVLAGVPVVYDFEAENVYEGEPLDYSKLTNIQRIAVVTYAQMQNRLKYPNDYTDLSELFILSTIPPINLIDLVAAVPIEGKLITMRMQFFLMPASNKIDTNPYRYQINQYSSGSSRNGVPVQGYWFNIQYREWMRGGAQQLQLSAKLPSQTDTSNGHHLYDWIMNR